MPTAVSTTTTPEEARAAARRFGPFTTTGLVITGVLALGFFGLFFRWFLSQNAHSWASPEDWGHAYLIPVIAGYLIWQRRHELERERAEVFWPALAPFLLGIMCYFFAVVQVRNHMIEGFSIILCLFGLTLLMIGPRMTRWVFLPIVYLVFAVTISEQIMIAVTFKLQLLASKGSYLMLSLIGAPTDWFHVEIDGNTLAIITNDGRSLPLNVAEACSGMRMVVAFYALAVSVALLACKHWWQRVLLILLAGPVAIFMNMVRVTVLGMASIFDQNLAAGDAHTLIGTILLVPSLLLFLGVVWALNRVVHEPKPGGAA